MRLVRILWAVVALGALALALAAATPKPAAAYSGGLCEGHTGDGVFCSLGKGRRTPGGNGKASHAGWPAVTGIHWSVTEGTTGQSGTGTDLNDELLGSHGGDVLNGGNGNDILWGDQLPVGNDTWQHDTMNGGAGNDWIYSSHGGNTIDGGAGNDHIWAHFGHGTVDCGSGYDVVVTTRHPKFTFKNCERIQR